MITAFVERRPWATIVVSLLLSPMLGMFYLGKGRKGLAYLGVEALAFAVPYIAAHFEILAGEPVLIQNYALLFVRIFGTAHCFIVAKRVRGERPRVWFARWYSIVALIIAAPILGGLAALVIRTAAFEPYNIPSASMLPTLRVGDHVLVSKYSYGYSKHSFPLSLGPFDGRIFGTEPARGDIAVFKLPSDNRTDYIKRIVGLPGDRIRMVFGVLHINDQPVGRRRIEDYLSPSLKVGAAQYVETLPSDRHYRVIEEPGGLGMLDNTAEFLVPKGHYFVLADNRDNAADSRVMNQIGFVPAENLIGRLEVIFWNSVERKFEFVTDFDRQAER